MTGSAATGRRGWFITVEGVEGAGKSTQVAVLERALTKALAAIDQPPPLVTREPGGSELGEAIRRLLLDPELPPMAQRTELLLMFAARAEHLEKRICPALQRGRWVLCDRFTDATYAYQGGGRGLPIDWIRSLEWLVQQGQEPDRTLLLDLPVEIGLQRVARRGAPDRIEQEHPGFFSRVRQVYLERSRAQPARFTVLDAGRSPDEVSADVAQWAAAWVQQWAAGTDD